MINMIYLVRHGKDDTSVRGGWSSSSLCDEGIDQVKKLAFSIKDIDIDCIYASDLQRAKDTARILGDSLNKDIIYRNEFREVHNGLLSGMKNDIAKELYPGLHYSTLNYNECYPEGESPQLFFNRISLAWHSFKDEVKDRNVMLVTHGGVIEVIMCIENNLEYTNKESKFKTEHASIIKLPL